MNRVHQASEGLVHEAMLVDEPETLKRLRRHPDVEVVAGPGRIHDLGPGPCDAGFDATAHLLGADHSSLAICGPDLEQVGGGDAGERSPAQLQLIGGTAVLS